MFNAEVGAKLRVRDVHVRLGSSAILTGISADIADGEIVALLGRSGSGEESSSSS